MADAQKKEYATYKGRPLVRCGDEIYYGNMEEPYVIRMEIKSKKTVNGNEIADKVTVQLMQRDRRQGDGSADGDRPLPFSEKGAGQVQRKERPFPGNGYRGYLAGQSARRQGLIKKENAVKLYGFTAFLSVLK